ncbi:bifunctional diguanylate cyclase/phosphodiesterase [Clostridium sp. AM58-1XD]|uniref:bifunctional diguanylate cyclase/phosphodiesterase n=1 Tax=Clostridium sp. AM58-1XD TaxID=2292307 RepID=UPI000E4D48E6|nr:bifunctional diguanylate cyclase/phosphodiesterase [Clostridium sp. AM58-1XD]RGY96828.1 bifunctional diguanylate cyclase/phosphodiesterase [Clostridium sp. AM58-1XD]
MYNIDYSRKRDPMTGLWSEEWVSKKIEDYLNSEEESGSAAFCLMEAPLPDQGYEIKDGNSMLKKFAFVLQQTMRKSDFAARVGEHHFIIFIMGCKGRRDALERLLFFRKNMKEEGIGNSCIFQAGIVLCSSLCHPKCSYEELLNKAKGALQRSRGEEGGFYAVPWDTTFNRDETGWELEPAGEYRISRKDADMDFVGEIMEGFQHAESFQNEIERDLERLGSYYGVDEAYIVERTAGERGYEITYEWKKNKGRVENNNLKRVPGIIGERYGRQFDSRGMIICTCMEALEELDPVMAERQKLRGTRSMMQNAVLESGTYIGYIGIADGSRERLWTDGEIMTFSMVSMIISSYLLQLRAKRSLEIITDYDLLTAAWNYNRFLVLGSEKLVSDGVPKAVVTVDIKNFKMINSQYGYEKGNEVLVEISNLLNFFTAGSECYARIEADKFVLLLEYQMLDGLQQRLKQLIRRVEQIPEQKLGVSVTCMVGVCLVEQGDSDLSVLVDHANMARKSLKDYHKSVYSFYNKEAEQKLIKERELTARMKGAVEKEEFVVYYQPKFSLKARKIIGMEALVRWKTGVNSLVPPDEFIPLFEKNGFITELDRYVFERVCRLQRRWMDEGRTVLPVSVNVSRIHIKEADFLTKLTDICGKYEIPAKNLELEITESAFLHNQEIVMAVARQIKDAGFLLSMDDFGTGYSSLSLLKDLPVDIIKLDKEFFQKKLNKRERIIIANVIRMAKQLDIQVISEGIETKENEQFLKEIGCNLAQGYLYGRPQPIEELETKL